MTGRWRFTNIATATVGTLSLITEDADALRGIILSRLLDDYASAHGITVSNREIDAYLALLQDAQEDRRFAIDVSELEQSFWEFFREDQRHSFVPRGSEEEARAFAIPTWASER